MAFKLEAKQKESIRAAVKRINLWNGSVRSGKTFGSLTAFIRFAGQYTGREPLIITGKTERTIERNILDPLGQLVGNSLTYTLHKGTGMLFDARLVFIGANDKKAEEKVRGLTAGGGYGDEVTLWQEAFFKMWMTRLSVKNSKAFLTTNTDTPYHYLKKDYIDNKDLDDFISFHFQLKDNTTLPSEYVRALMQEYKGLWKKRFIDGLWVIAEGSIYDCYNDGMEVDNPKYDIKEAIQFIGIDYGTSNPTVFLKIYVWFNKRTGRPAYIYIGDMYYYDSGQGTGQRSDKTYAVDLKRFIGKDRPAYIIVDPSAASFITELEQTGFSNIVRADNSVIDGIRYTYSLMDSGVININKHNCPILIEELCGYVWDKGQQLQGIDAPVKIKDHSPDALRYVMQTVFNSGEINIPLILSMNNIR